MLNAVTTYSIESSCARTSAYQHTAVVHSKREMIEHCTADWRKQSVHVVYVQPGYAPRRMFAVFVNGRCVSPLLNDLARA